MTCVVCGTTTTDEAPGRVFGEDQYCESCYGELALGKHDDPNPRRQSQRRHRPDRDLTTTPAATPSVRAEQGSAAICVLLGLLFMLVSVYFVVVAPSGGSTEFLGRTLAVTRLQRLAIGQSSSIIGAIYLAAGFRPR